MAGKLVIIGTPIGNLGDMTPRAIEAMRGCTRIVCEDTRHTRKLLSHFGIDVTLESFHEHNEDEKAAAIVDAIVGGEVIGIASDAGMPVLSDPGFALMRAARERGVPTEVIPGPFAAALALAASGIPPLPFTFYGFSPHRAGERREFYRDVAAAKTTAVMYESPERLIESLHDARTEMGDVAMTVAREMTKLHEEFIHGTISEVLEQLTDRDRVKGEITLVFAAAESRAVEIDPAQIRAEFERLRASGVRRNDAVKALAEQHGLRKNELYRILLDQE